MVFLVFFFTKESPNLTALQKKFLDEIEQSNGEERRNGKCYNRGNK